MRENEPVLLVLSVCDGEIILEKGEILCEKCHLLNAYGYKWKEEYVWSEYFEEEEKQLVLRSR